MHIITETQAIACLNALRIAAARYKEDARVMRAEGQHHADGGNYHGQTAYGRVALQFDQQANDASTLADLFESGDLGESDDDEGDLPAEGTAHNDNPHHTHTWIADPTSHGLIDTCPCGAERA